MENKFKVGDKVRRNNNSYGGMDIGDTGIVTEVIENEYIKLKQDGSEKIIQCWTKYFELVSSNGKKVKAKPVVLHLVLGNDCNNVICLKDNYEDAKKQLPPTGKTYTIYKLIAVAKLENAVKVTKLK